MASSAGATQFTNVDVSDTLTAPTSVGKIDRNDIIVDDDDCTGEQGLWWYDTTDSAFEFCNSDSGIPSEIGAGDIASIDELSDFLGFFNGTFQESFNAVVTSDTVLITMSIQSKAAGDLTMRFSDGTTVFDCTPADTIELTAGTDISPQSNYIYILQSDKILTKSTSGCPPEEHIKIPRPNV